MLFEKEKHNVGIPKSTAASKEVFRNLKPGIGKKSGKMKLTDF